MSAILFQGEWILRSSIMILAVAMLLWLLRQKNPSVRLTAWTAVLVGSLVIPLLIRVLPRLPIAVPQSTVRPSTTVRAVGIGPEMRLAQGTPALGPDSPVPRVGGLRFFDWARIAVLAYALVSGALLLRLFVGLVVSRRIIARSRPTGITADGAEVRESGNLASPAAIGVVRPAILLPLDWHGWASAKLDAVLAHEGSHIRRRDPALQFLSAIHRALLWASPAAWYLHGSIVRSAEEISDNHAIAAMGDRVAYADILLEFVQRGVGDPAWAGVPMARYDRPERRIRRILNSSGVPRGVTRWSVAAVLALAAPFAWLAAAAHPQSASRPAPASSAPLTVALPEFEVASVKAVVPNVPHEMGVHVYPGGRVVITTFPLKTLIQTAFGLSYWQISGGDEWTQKGEYTVEAKPSAAMLSSIKDLRYTLFGIEDEHLREMLQALLIDRFQLKFHREMKTGDVYLLERSGKPLKIRPVESMPPGADSYSDSHSFGSIGYAGGQWNIFATSMPQLAKFASDFVLHVPVLDRTGLSGRFKYRQRWPDLDPKYDGDQSDSFRGYLKEIGLKLVPDKGPVETFVIDHAAKPSPN